MAGDAYNGVTLWFREPTFILTLNVHHTDTCGGIHLCGNDIAVIRRCARYYGATSKSHIYQVPGGKGNVCFVMRFVILTDIADIAGCLSIDSS
jgi:hypothetical protein